MTKEDLFKRIENDFKYHPPSPKQQEKYVFIREEAKKLATALIHYCPLGRELSIALTKLEEVVMHANAGIARCKVDNDDTRSSEGSRGHG